MSRDQSSVILCGQPQLPNGSLKSIGNGQPPSLVWAVLLTRGTVFGCHCHHYPSHRVFFSIKHFDELMKDNSDLLWTFHVKISNIWVRARAVWWVWPETESQHCYRDRDRQTAVRISGAITTTQHCTECWPLIGQLSQYRPLIGQVWAHFNEECFCPDIRSNVTLNTRIKWSGTVSLICVSLTYL